MESVFPKEMLNNNLTLESIISKLVYFQEQIHLQHWQTISIAQHTALGELYTFIEGFKDDVVEKIIGYNGKRPGIYPLIPLTNSKPDETVLKLLEFAKELKNYAEKNNYLDISNLADSFSGQIAKSKYLLTMQ